MLSVKKVTFYVVLFNDVALLKYEANVSQIFSDYVAGVKLTSRRSLRGKVSAENPEPVLPVFQGFSFDKLQSGPMHRTCIIFYFLFLENMYLFLLSSIEKKKFTLQVFSVL